MPNPAGSVPASHVRPPSVVNAATPAVKPFGPSASFQPTAVQSRPDEQCSDCIESPARIGASVKLLPPSLVERNVAFVAPIWRNSLEAARPAQNSAEGHDSVSRWPTPVGSGATANECPPSHRGQRAPAGRCRYHQRRNRIPRRRRAGSSARSLAAGETPSSSRPHRYSRTRTRTAAAPPQREMRTDHSSCSRSRCWDSSGRPEEAPPSCSAATCRSGRRRQAPTSRSRCPAAVGTFGPPPPPRTGKAAITTIVAATATAAARRPWRECPRGRPPARSSADARSPSAAPRDCHCSISGRAGACGAAFISSVTSIRIWVSRASVTVLQCLLQT